jgi:hypothetical protein
MLSSIDTEVVHSISWSMVHREFGPEYTLSYDEFGSLLDSEKEKSSSFAAVAAGVVMTDAETQSAFL